MLKQTMRTASMSPWRTPFPIGLQSEAEAQEAVNSAGHRETQSSALEERGNGLSKMTAHQQTTLIQGRAEVEAASVAAQEAQEVAQEVAGVGGETAVKVADAGVGVRAADAEAEVGDAEAAKGLGRINGWLPGVARKCTCISDTPAGLFYLQVRVYSNGRLYNSLADLVIHNGGILCRDREEDLLWVSKISECFLQPAPNVN